MDARQLSEQIRSLRQQLSAAGTPARAEAERAYLKSTLTFLGAPVPVIRRTARDFVRAQGELERAELAALARQLWRTDVHELRSLAIALLAEQRQVLRAADIALIEDLLRESDTWAHVDWLAASVAGALVARYRTAARRLDRWARDESFWLRRAALLALLEPLRRGGGDFERFAELAAPQLDDREFFIRKAIGWVLREVSKKRPELSSRFLTQHLERVSGLTLREGSKYLPGDQRERLLAHHRALRAAPRPRRR